MDDSTCWTLIESAARGDTRSRDEIVQRYGQMIRAYFGSRWRGARCDVDDAAHEVILECLKPKGALERADRHRTGGFRPFLLAVCRHVAQRHERRVARAKALDDGAERLDDVEVDDRTPSAEFDRAWAAGLVATALQQLQVESQSNEASGRRLEILRRRHLEDTPIRDLAAEWRADPAELHHEYARARSDFQRALRDALRFDLGNGKPVTEATLKMLLELLR